MTNDQLAARLERLERSHSRLQRSHLLLKRFATVLGLLLAATFAGAMNEDEVPDVIRAKRFEVPSPNGDGIAVWIGSHEALVEEVTHLYRQPQSPPGFGTCITDSGISLGLSEEGDNTEIRRDGIRASRVTSKRMRVLAEFPGLDARYSWRGFLQGALAEAIQTPQEPRGGVTIGVDSGGAGFVTVADKTGGGVEILPRD